MRIFASHSTLEMLSTRIDTDDCQFSEYDRARILRCPVCGNILAEVVSLSTASLMRFRCHKCKRFIKISCVESPKQPT